MSYNNELQSNNAELQEILKTVNELPDADDASDAVRYTAQELTDAQKAQARSNIGAIDEAKLLDELAKRGQLAPEYAESLEWLGANGDQSKMYVLPDGFIYAYMLTEKEVESGAGYTNVIPTSKDTDGVTVYGADYNGDGANDGYLKSTRLSGSSGSTATAGELCCATGFITAKVGDIVRIKGAFPIEAVLTCPVMVILPLGRHRPV